jgi:toxin FitB
MILLDTNIFIYLANGTVKASILGSNTIAYASITKIEALGYAQITGKEQSLLEELFDACEEIELDERVIQRAIKLRQQTKITLGDAIVAASALVHDCELWTANEKDFAHLENLSLHNPL